MILALCCHIKNDVIESIRLQFFSPPIFTAVKNAISHLKGHKICFLEKIKWSSWKLTTFQEKNQIKEISKISQKILVQLKYCENTLLRKFQVNRKHFPSSMMTGCPENRVKNTKPEINYDFFSTKTTGSNFIYHGNPAQSQVTRPYLNLHNSF